MPLDHITGYGFTPVAKKDYCVIFVQSGILQRTTNLTLFEAAQMRDAHPAGEAIVVRTTEVLGGKCFQS
jgi:hypothetical protein